MGRAAERAETWRGENPVPSNGIQVPVTLGKMDMWLIGQIGGELAMCIMGTGVFDRWVSLLILGEKEEGEAVGVNVGLKPLFLASLRIRVL